MAPRETGNGLGKMGIHPGTPGIAAEITGIPSGTLGMVSGISGIPPGKREFPQESGNCLRRTRIPPKNIGFPPQQIPWNGQFPVFGDTRTPKTKGKIPQNWGREGIFWDVPKPPQKTLKSKGIHGNNLHKLMDLGM